jgi:hypothetical protein
MDHLVEQCQIRLRDGLLFKLRHENAVQCFARYNLIGWDLKPGDAVFFHVLTLHAASGAGSGRRRVLSVRFLGDDIRHAPRRWKTSPEFLGLEAELPAGAPMNHPLPCALENARGNRQGSGMISPLWRDRETVTAWRRRPPKPVRSSVARPPWQRRRSNGDRLAIYRNS